MQTLDQAHLGQIYYVAGLKNGSYLAQLRKLGFGLEAKVQLVSKTGDLAIVHVEDTRLALRVEYLQEVMIKDQRTKEKLLSLSDLTPQQTGTVSVIEAPHDIKRRLMDMGITRGTSIYVRKMAPLGDPMELYLRGYSLSLRKVDAQMIKVILLEKSI